MIPRRSFLAFVLLSFVCLCCSQCHAWTLPPEVLSISARARRSPSSSSSGKSLLLLRAQSSSSSDNDDDEDNHNDSEVEQQQKDEIEQARQQLILTMMQGDSDDASSNGNNARQTTNRHPLALGLTNVTDLCNPAIALPVTDDEQCEAYWRIPGRPLTSLERRRRQAEIGALQALASGTTEATDGLWDLWFQEKGNSACKALEATDALLGSGDPRQWKECERQLLALIEVYNADDLLDWIEPWNRLATLYYLQGRYEESYKLCRLVLLRKPWHIGALSGLVAVCVGLGRRSEARQWATLRMPPPMANTGVPPFVSNVENPRRTEWVHRAVQQARDYLQEWEKSTKEWWGQDTSQQQQVTDESSSSASSDTDADAWQ